MKKSVGCWRNGNEGEVYNSKNNPLIEKHVILQDFVVIGKDGSQEAKCRTQIGKGTRILTGAIVYNGCYIGENCLIADHASVRETVELATIPSLVGMSVSK